MSATSAKTCDSVLKVGPILLQKGISGGGPLLLGLFIGYRWGVPEMGLFTLAYSVVAIGVVLTDWGCARWLPREMALSIATGRPSDLIPASNVIRIATAVAVFVCSLVAVESGLIGKGALGYVLAMGGLYFVSIAATNGLSDRIVRGQEAAIGRAVAAGLVGFLLAAAGLSLFAPGPLTVTFALVLGRATEAFLLCSSDCLEARFEWNTITDGWRTLLPFNVQAVLGIFYAKAPVLMMGALAGLHELGTLAAALSIQGTLMLLPVSVALLYYPRLAEAVARRDLRGIRRITWRYLTICGAGLTVGFGVVLVLAPTLLGILHIANRDSAFVLTFVGASYTTIGTSFVGFLLLALGGERSASWLSLLTACTAFALQAALIAALGLWGALVAYIGYETVSVAVFAIACVRRIRRRVWVADAPEAAGAVSSPT